MYAKILRKKWYFPDMINCKLNWDTEISTYEEGMQSLNMIFDLCHYGSFVCMLLPVLTSVIYAMWKINSTSSLIIPILLTIWILRKVNFKKKKSSVTTVDNFKRESKISKEFTSMWIMKTERNHIYNKTFPYDSIWHLVCD